MARKLYCPDCGQAVDRLYIRVKGVFTMTPLAICHNSACDKSDTIPDGLEYFVKAFPLTNDPNAGGDQ